MYDKCYSVSYWKDYEFKSHSFNNKRDAFTFYIECIDNEILSEIKIYVYDDTLNNWYEI